MISSSLHKRFSHCLANAQTVAFFFERLSSSEHKTKQYPAIWLFTFWLSKNYMCVCAAAKQQRWTSKLIFSFAIHCSFIHPLTHSLVHSLSTARIYHIVCMRFILLFFVHILFQFDFIFFTFLSIVSILIFISKNNEKKCMVIITGMNTSSIYK